MRLSGRIAPVRGAAHIRFALAMMAAIAALFGAPAPASATFPGATGRLALDAYQVPTSRIWTVNPDGSGITHLTTGLSPDGRRFENAGASAWSPDGEQLAFSSYDLIDPPKLEIMDADGSNRRTIFQGTRTHFVGAPAWSPDGSKLVVTNGSGLFMIDVHGGAPTPITMAGDVPPVIRAPDWSPDGSKIAFEGAFLTEEVCDEFGCFAEELPSDIYVVNPDGSGLKAVTSPCLGVQCGKNTLPSWSPDGSKIVFGHAYDIYTIDVDGTNYKRLAEGDTPVWSPDGKQIAFAIRVTNPPGASGDVFVMDVDGANPKMILDGGDGLSKPAHRVAGWQAIPNRPPDCSGVTASTAVLWPANKKFRLVELSGAMDPEGDAVQLEVTGVTQDEPVGPSPDARLPSGEAVLLQAERDPRGDGRVYDVAFRASDSKGASCEGSASVGVPRKRKHAAVDSAPPIFDSLHP